MVLYQLPMGLRDATNRSWGEILKKSLGGAEEDEDEAFVLFFLLHLNSMVEARPLLCLEIEIHNESS